jgi:oligopeptide transport system substrate-binding protein
VHLSRPNRIFESVLTFPTLFPVPAHVIDAHGEAWCRAGHFVGNGPYYVSEEKLGESITLAANPHYYQSVPVSKLVAHTPGEFKLMVDLYKSGKLDWLGMQVAIGADELATLLDHTTTSGFKKNDVSRHPLMDVSFIAINTRRGALSDARVRRALSLALDRDDLAKNVLRDGTVPAGNFIPPGIGSYKPIPSVVAQNCKEAQAWLAEAGFPNGHRFPKYELLARSGGREPTVASAIADQWNKCLGIQVSQLSMEMKLWLVKVGENKDYDLTLHRWLGDYPHPQTFAALLQSQNPQNDSLYNNSEYDQAIAVGVAAMNDRDIQQAYATAEGLIERDKPVISLFYSPRIHALRPGWQGINNNTVQYHPLRNLRRADPALAKD